MTTLDIDNINVSAFDPMPSPDEIAARLPLSASAAGEVRRDREVLRNILDRLKLIGDGPMSLYYIDKEIEKINKAELAAEAAEGAAQ